MLFGARAGLGVHPAVEIAALIGAIIAPVTILMIARSQKFWFENVTKRYWHTSAATTLLSLLAAAALLVVLLKELTIVRSGRSVVFGMALVALALAPFSKYMINV